MSIWGAPGNQGEPEGTAERKPFTKTSTWKATMPEMKKNVTSIDYKEIVNKHAKTPNLSQCIEGRSGIDGGGMRASKQSAE